MISKGVRIKRAEIGGYTYVSRDARLLDCSVGRVIAALALSA